MNSAGVLWRITDGRRYWMKFRFYFEEYTPPTNTTYASHQNLVRMFRETEVSVGSTTSHVQRRADQLQEDDQPITLCATV